MCHTLPQMGFSDSHGTINGIDGIPFHVYEKSSTLLDRCLKNSTSIYILILSHTLQNYTQSLLDRTSIRLHSQEAKK